MNMKKRFNSMDKLFYVLPDMAIEDCLSDQMLCDSFVGGLEDTIDDPIY